MNELFPYQKIGAEWLANAKDRWLLLADEPGLGKTAQALEAINKLRIREALVVCPAIARLNWFGEVEKFAKVPLRLHAYSFNTTFTERDTATAKKSHTVRPKKELLRPWPLLIVDESHYLASPSSQRSRAVYLHIAPYAERVWCLSGTPAKNHAGDMFTLLKASGLFTGTYEQFAGQFCTTIDTPYGQRIIGSKNITALRKLWEPIMLRRRKQDVLPELPPLLFCDVCVEPGPVNAERWFPQAALGVEALNGLLQSIEREQAAMRLLLDHLPEEGASAQALAPLEHGLEVSRQWVELQKVEPVAELVAQELDDNQYDKIILFCWHKSVIAEFRHRLHRFNPARISGDTRGQAKHEQERKFQFDPTCRVLIGQTISCGISVTLTAATEVGVVGPAYTPADNTQAVLRAHRIGQHHPVRARFFYIDNGTDKKKQRILMRKTKEMAEMFDPLINAVDPLEGLEGR